MSHTTPCARAKQSLPIVLLPADNVRRAGTALLAVGPRYVAAVRRAGALPLVVPNAEPAELPALLARADGILLTGARSNVHPEHFGAAVHDPALPLDRERDRWTLPLIRDALQWGIPLLAICRGMQEMNVALGGSLHQAVHELPGRIDHRDAAAAPPEVQYAPAHEVTARPGGLLATLAGVATFAVNSLHGQAVDRLAPGLQIEAHAPDGTVEALTAPAAPAFNLGVQWHPEWQAADNPVSQRILAAFGRACAAHAARRAEVAPPEQ